MIKHAAQWPPECKMYYDAPFRASFPSSLSKCNIPNSPTFTHRHNREFHPLHRLTHCHLGTHHTSHFQTHTCKYNLSVVKFLWTLAHCDIPGNERADAAFKEMSHSHSINQEPAPVADLHHLLWEEIARKLDKAVSVHMAIGFNVKLLCQ